MSTAIKCALMIRIIGILPQRLAHSRVNNFAHKKLTENRTVAQNHSSKYFPIQNNFDTLIISCTVLYLNKN